MLNKEMHELRKALDNAGIEWRDDSEVRAGMFFERTKFNNKFGDACSVVYIEGFSIGWQGGFLESMPPVHFEEIDDADFWQDEVEGYLTAQEIVDAWL